MSRYSTYNTLIDFYSGYKDCELSSSFVERTSFKLLACDIKSQNN